MALVCLLLGPLKSWGMDSGHLEGQCGGMFVVVFFKELTVLADLLAGRLLCCQ